MFVEFKKVRPVSMQSRAVFVSVVLLEIQTASSPAVVPKSGPREKNPTI